MNLQYYSHKVYESGYPETVSFVELKGECPHCKSWVRIAVPIDPDDTVCLSETIKDQQHKINYLIKELVRYHKIIDKLMECK